MAIEMFVSDLEKIADSTDDLVKRMGEAFNLGVRKTSTALENDILKLERTLAVVKAIILASYGGSSLLFREDIADALTEVFDSQKEALHRISSVLGLSSDEDGGSTE